MGQQILQDQVAVVTGASSGIGYAIAKLFVKEGAYVVMVGSNSAKGEKAHAELMHDVAGAKAEYRQADVSDYKATHALVDNVLQNHGKIDILVNCAGITRDNLLMKISEEDWDLVMDTNIKSCYNMCHAAVRAMMKARKGRIINVSSVIGEIGNSGQTNYAASKAAISGFSKALAKEIAPRNILVNVIAPGWVETPMTEALNPEQTKAILDQVPLGRKAAPEEIAGVALFLACDQSSYITGEVLLVSGGLGI
jgi:3-oxoacyl-[acyl-carrier protein] reductase